MERMTMRSSLDGGVLIKVREGEYQSLCFGCERIGRCKNRCDEYKAHLKLADYEDMEEQGRLVKLPCAIGDKYYEIVDECNFPDDCYTKAMCKGCDYREMYVEEKITSSLSDIQHVIYYLNKIVFLTQEQAEQALQDMKRDNQ